MKKILFGCLWAFVLVVVGGGALIWFWVIRELPALDASLSMPPEVALESSFDMVVTVTNPHKEAVAIGSIDVDAAFLSAFQVVRIVPEPKSTMKVPLINQRSWEFGLPVQPNGTNRVTFTLRAVEAGHFSGDIDVCNPNEDFKTLFADILVTKGSPVEATGIQ